MKEFKAKNKHKVLKVTPEEIRRWGGLCICDMCNGYHDTDGYVIGVLNYCVCRKCFDKWDERTKNQHYPQDVPFETEIINKHKELIL